MGIRFEVPKPAEAANRLMTGVVGSGELGLDFFAVSGTASQAIMEMNCDSHRDVRSILVQIPEYIENQDIVHEAGHKTDSDFCVDRLRKWGENH